MLGLPSAIRWPWRAGANEGTLALTLTEHSMRFLLATETGEQGATVTAWGTELRGVSSRDAFMKRVAARLPSAKRVIAVLDPRDYQIMQVEAPNVPAEEMRGAVRWRAMEFFDGSPHNFTLDILTMHQDEESFGGIANVIVVAAQNDVVKGRMQDCAMLDLPLSIIDIPETAQRNLLNAATAATAKPGDVAGVLAVDAGRALMTVAVGGELQFFRRFEFDIDKLLAAGEIQSALMSDSPEAEAISRSLMQLHRSMDLWEDNHPRQAIGSMAIAAGTRSDVLADRLRAELGIETRTLVLDKVFRLKNAGAAPPWADVAYLPLLGALLRPVE